MVNQDGQLSDSNHRERKGEPGHRSSDSNSAEKEKVNQDGQSNDSNRRERLHIFYKDVACYSHALKFGNASPLHAKTDSTATLV